MSSNNGPITEYLKPDTGKKRRNGDDMAIPWGQVKSAIISCVVGAILTSTVTLYFMVSSIQERLDRLVPDHTSGILNSKLLEPSTSFGLGEKQAQQLDWLYNKHNVMDGDGVPVWHIRQSLKDELKALKTLNQESVNKLNSIEEKLGILITVMKDKNK